MKIYNVPTGHICIMEGEKGKLEFLSVGDYGKEKNLKADFLGLTKEIEGVPHGELLPLEEKWVITISSQYGCEMGCRFCDVPKVGFKGNATFLDLINQVNKATSLHPEVKKAKRINLHYARMGEPTFNPAVIDSAYFLAGVFAAGECGFHPVVSTMMPRTLEWSKLFNFLERWLDLKDTLNGEAGLQISINTTDEIIRQRTMPYAMHLSEISSMFTDLLQYREIPKGRKLTLNFALTEDEVDAKKLRDLFSPRYFICKLTPMHNTKAVIHNGMITDGGYDHYYPYKMVEEALKAEGFDVIVFIPSKEEDESRITCGNVILSDKIL
jgi:23S rRNA (adenine2503-C2)-methyltransferase